jgi:hypothetical protein
MHALPIPALISISGLLAIGTIYFVWARKVDPKAQPKAEHKAEQK